VIAAIWKNDLRHWLIWLNLIALAALIIYVVRSVYSSKHAESEEKLPANLTEFFNDDDLEGRRLERVQGWALLFAAIIAIALPIYWLREPTRQSQANNYFDKNSVARGATLFANSSMPAYNPAMSLQCANCHGQKGQGGVASTSINGQKVEWKAPPLNTELLRFSPDEVTQIITYGRPGTPMQAWGVAGGGPKNDQAIQDLVSYINSIQITPDQAKAEATSALAAAKSTDPNTTCPEYVTCPAVEVATARKTLQTDTAALTTARTDLRKALGKPKATDAELKAQCNQITAEAEKQANASAQTKSHAITCGTYLAAARTVASDNAAYQWSLKWQASRKNVSDGQILFEMNCARCHTQGWSVFDPTAPPSEVNGVSILGLSGGGGGTGGGTGFNLRDGGEMRRFGSDVDGGFAAQQDFVTMGSEANKLYGNLGIGTGRMPGFGAMLTKDQIAEIISYERYCLEATNYNGTTAKCATGTQPRTPATSTTVATTTTVPATTTTQGKGG
jgi:mono/diheme cytochrome c family protein